MNTPKKTEQLRAVFEGRVQGVGFRAQVQDLAFGFAVTGFVRNRLNGTVELVCCGEPHEVQAFLKEIRERMKRHIVGCDTCWSPGDQANPSLTAKQSATPDNSLEPERTHDFAIWPTC
ncbi:MAG: acylphosphatase [Pirellulaceae bacterium]